MIKSFRTKYFSIVLLTFKPYTTSDPKGFYVDKWYRSRGFNFKTKYRWLAVGVSWDKNSSFRFQDQPQPEPESEDELLCGKCDRWVTYTNPEFREYRCDICGAKLIY